jgi:hypothetical protein
LNEELGDARLRAAQLKEYVQKAIELIEKSDHRDHFFEVAAHLIHGIPDTLFRLDKALDAAAMAAAKMDYEEIKQGLKPEKAEELERVLDDVRLRYLKRRSVDMNAKNAAEILEKLAEVTEATGAIPVEEVAKLVHQLEQGMKTASVPTTGAVGFFRKAAEHLRTTPNPSRVRLAKGLRKVIADVLAGEPMDPTAGAGEEFKKENPKLTDEDVEKINAEHEKNKDVVKDKAKSATDSVAEEAKESRFEKGKPADPTENMSKEDKDRWWEEHDKNKDKFKTAKLMSRQEAILKKYVQSGGNAMEFDALPQNVQSELRRVKDQETLWMDVDRWLRDNKYKTPSYSANWWERSADQVEVEAGAGEEFKKENPKITDEEVEKINAEHEKNKDNFKSASTTPWWK